MVFIPVAFRVEHAIQLYDEQIRFPVFSMLMFVFIGKFVGFNDPAYIVIGNILLMPSINGLYGISMTIGNERQFGAMSYLLGSPAPRAPLFLGRAFFHIIDGFITVLIALPIAILFFDLGFSEINLLLLACCLILLSITTTGLGFIMGTISLRSRDGWMFTNTLGQLLSFSSGLISRSKTTGCTATGFRLPADDAGDQGSEVDT